MATLKCLACGQDNKIGDESCTSCSSSLNLRLCSVCEAINANSAEGCHSCGAQFSPEGEVASSVEQVAQEAPPYEKVLPSAWVLGAEQATRRSRRATAALWLVPVLAVAGATYYFYGAPQAAPKQAAVVPLAPAAAAQVSAVRPVEVKTAPAPQPEARTAFEPKRALAPVTHTRTGGVETPIKTIPAAAPLVPAAVPAVTEVAPVRQEPRSRVTHTKAAAATVGDAGVAGFAPSPDITTVPVTAAKLEPAGCAPGVAALGLCKSN